VLSETPSLRASSCPVQPMSASRCWISGPGMFARIARRWRDTLSAWEPTVSLILIRRPGPESHGQQTVLKLHNPRSC
jgi:hypothetical protein